jgi:cytochrome c peroxidase
MAFRHYCGLLGLLLSTTIAAQDAAPPAPGYSPLAFRLPAAGSYRLPTIGPAGDGELLTVDSHARRLHQLMDDKVVVLSFIYTSCSDRNGCPLATQVLHKISRQLRQQPALAQAVRLLTVSFNPSHDSPAQMRDYQRSLESDGVDWQFLSSRDDASLQPLLEAYPQNIRRQYDENGQFSGSFSHLLRVYLIDTHKQIRNIYSVDFLHADTVINDIKTLLLTQPTAPAPLAAPQPPALHAGDDKQHYDQRDYQTHSQAISQRLGQPAQLLALAQTPPLGLPRLPQPADNRLSAAKIALGRKLFYDRRLSFNNTLSCGLCHIPEQGFSSQESRTAIGIEGRSVRRNSPSLYNVGYAQLLFHDGRENTLEQQVWGPLLAHNEMANPSIGYVVDKLKHLADYRGGFENAFNRPPSMLTIAQALASYQRTLNAADSAFDRWYYGKQTQALDAAAQRGFALFTGAAGCSQCHQLDPNAALFTDHKRHNTGIGFAASMLTGNASISIQLAPGQFIQAQSQHLSGLQAPKPNDLGYYEITQNPADRWAYKTPSLRNVALTAPYMHDGSLPTLEAVVQFYNQGGIANDNLSPLIKPLQLSDSDRADLVAFLNSLTGNNVQDLVADAFAAPIGDSP